jgi:hypothetical protein
VFSGSGQFTPAAFGKEFNYQGETYRIEGWHPGNHVYKILTLNLQTGNIVNFPSWTCQNQLASVAPLRLAAKKHGLT